MSRRHATLGPPRHGRQRPRRARREMLLPVRGPAPRWIRAAAILVFAVLLVSWGAAPGAGAPEARAAQAAAPQTSVPESPAPLTTSPSTTEPSGAVWVTRATGIIDPALAGFLTKTMTQAADAKASALVIELDTPGGLDSSMRQIIQAELDSPIPVVLYVYPQGARAASAGVYILMGSDIAAMAPQTNLGAATPVALGGNTDDTMKAKITNDAAAYIVALAKNHGRNATWAEQAVREAVSLPADQALAQNVVDVVAPDLPSLLTAIDGRTTKPKGLTLHTAGVPIEETGMGWVAGFLHAIANPDIAYVLMIVGILGLLFEVAAPGHIVSGLVGVIALLLSFYGLAVLPVSFIGIALIVLAFILFVLELKIQSHGALGIGGVIALVLGGLLLFNTSAPYARVGWPVLAAVAVLAAAAFALVISRIRIALRRPHATGVSVLVGCRGVALSGLDPNGQVRVRGEIWRARTEGEVLLKDEPIEVLGVEGLTLVVRRVAEQ
jgi:membrane-bound serine protease (ClpP class)